MFMWIKFPKVWQNYEDLHKTYSYPQKMTWVGWASPFRRTKSGFWGPMALQNEEPATNLAKGLSTKSGRPTPFLLVHFCDFQNHWPLQSGEPNMRTHLSRILTWNKANPKNTKINFVEGWCERTLVSPENPEIYKNSFSRGNSCSTFPVVVIHIVCIYYIYAHEYVDTPQNLYRMRSLQFQPTTTCTPSKIRNL